VNTLLVHLNDLHVLQENLTDKHTWCRHIKARWCGWWRTSRESRWRWSHACL